MEPSQRISVRLEHFQVSPTARFGMALVAAFGFLVMVFVPAVALLAAVYLGMRVSSPDWVSQVALLGTLGLILANGLGGARWVARKLSR